jgi:hypothetical protein
VLRAYPDTITMDIHCAPIGLWQSLAEKSFAKFCRIRINPVDTLDSGSVPINEFVGEYMSNEALYLSISTHVKKPHGIGRRPIKL